MNKRFTEEDDRNDQAAIAVLRESGTQKAQNASVDMYLDFRNGGATFESALRCTLQVVEAIEKGDSHE